MTAVSTPSLKGVSSAPDRGLANARVALNRLVVLDKVVGELLSVIEDVLGSEDAENYANVVADSVASWIDATYHEALGPDDFSVERLAHIFVDLKSRLGAQYTVRSVDDDAIVLRNVAGLFGHHTRTLHSLTAMAATVFARIAAENTGYARIEFRPSAAGGPNCADIELRFRPAATLVPGEHEFYRVGQLAFD